MRLRLIIKINLKREILRCLQIKAGERFVMLSWILRSRYQLIFKIAVHEVYNYCKKQPMQSNAVFILSSFNQTNELKESRRIKKLSLFNAQYKWPTKYALSIQTPQATKRSGVKLCFLFNK